MKAKDLRNSILQMAVQGKLVPQDPNDEPASVLLERIRAERAKLIKEKKIKAPKGGESIIYRASDGSHYEKRGKGEPVCIDDEIPFEIPESWAWVRLESCCRTVIDCPHSTPNYLVEDTGFYAIDTNCMDEDWNQTSLRRLSEDSYEKRVARYAPQPGDLVLSREGSIGRSVILRQDNVCLGQRVMVLSFFDEGLLNSYCQLVLTSPYTWALYMAANVGTGVKHINVSMIKNILIPLPPRSEQIRITEMIDDLQPHVNECGALEDARERMDAELPGRLRKSVLQLAVQGKLVPQDPHDEPASALLGRIRTERAKLIREKKIRAPKGGESVIYRASDGGYYEKRGKGEPQPIDVPFEIPDSWEWARLSSVISIAGGGTPDKGTPSYWNGGIPWASVKDLKGDTLESTIDSISAEGLASKPSISKCSSGDLIVATRLVPGKSIICSIECVINQDLKRIRTSLNVEYLHIWFQNERQAFHRLGQGTTVPGIKLGDLEGALIPIPPAAEQQRICLVFNDVSRQLTR